MADRTQLRVADHNVIADDDPFAELTRIMGFDPRQPVKPQAPAQAVGADHAMGEGDFDIDLEKELMGEFAVDDSDAIAIAAPHEPTFEAAAPGTADDALALSLDDDFHLDMADVDDMAAAGHAGGTAAKAAPSVEAAFDADFDNAVAMSLGDVSPFEDDLPIEDELAASLDHDFPIDEEVVDTRHAYADVSAATEPGFDHEFDDAVAISLEDELMMDDKAAEHAATGPVGYSMPVSAGPSAAPAVSDGNFAGDFEDAMADIDFDLSADRPAAFDGHEAHDVLADAAGVSDGISGDAASDAAFDLNFDDVFAEEPVAEAATAWPEAPAVHTPPVNAPAVSAPAVSAPAASMIEPVAMKNERSLEDELSALLGAMTARTAPVREPVAAQPAVAARPVLVAQPAVVAQPRVVAQPPAAPAANTQEGMADLVGDLDWDLDEHAPQETRHQAAHAADIDLGDLLADELHEHARGEVASSQNGSADSLDWLAERSAPVEPSRSWSRVTPVPQQPAFAAEPSVSMAAVSMAARAGIAPAVATVPSYRPVEAAAHAAPVSAPQAQQPARYEEMPDVETVDVPERVVALADDLDIPELHFEEDEPATAGYDDLDAEFASLLTEMNAVDAAAAPAPSGKASALSYEDESYNAGFRSGYEPEARTYAARPAEMPARTATSAYADAADGFDLDNLPGNQPVSQADDFTVDELDYDPELDEAMSVPGLGEREAAKPLRRRGLFIAAIVGAVAVAGGLGAFALSFGGKGGSQAPVIVKADNSPIKIKPENPGGTVVPNQDNKVYDAVIKGAKTAEPVQEKLVTNSEEPVDVQAKDTTRVVDLAPDNANAADGADAASATAAAPAPKSEDRIAQVLQDADKGTNPDVVAVAPRKVRTMVVKSDGSLVPREDPAPAAPQVAAAEPTDPAPQHVTQAQADAEPTGTVAPAISQADAEPALKPVAKPAAKAQSANTPAKVPVAPQRPSDQPVDVVGEVKPDQVASIDPAATAAGGGSWSMQIASQPTVESAQSSYQDLQRRYGSVLAGRTANIVKAEIAGKGTFYRVRVLAQSRNDAINLCTSYKAAGGNCFVSR